MQRHAPSLQVTQPAPSAPEPKLLPRVWQSKRLPLHQGQTPTRGADHSVGEGRTRCGRGPALLQTPGTECQVPVGEGGPSLQHLQEARPVPVVRGAGWDHPAVPGIDRGVPCPPLPPGLTARCLSSLESQVPTNQAWEAMLCTEGTSPPR